MRKTHSQKSWTFFSERQFVLNLRERTKRAKWQTIGTKLYRRASSVWCNKQRNRWIWLGRSCHCTSSRSHWMSRCSLGSLEIAMHRNTLKSCSLIPVLLQSSCNCDTTILVMTALKVALLTQQSVNLHTPCFIKRTPFSFFHNSFKWWSIYKKKFTSYSWKI